MAGGASQLTDPERSAEIEKSWRLNAQKWTGAVRAGEIDSRRLVTDKAIAEGILACKPHRVLDLGCGEGWLVRLLSAQGIECVGVDGCPKLIEAAEDAGAGEFLLCSYSELITEPALAGVGFDLIVANFALLAEDVAPLLKALSTVLAKGGNLLIQTTHPWSVGGSYTDEWRLETFRGFSGSWEPMPWYFRTLGSWLSVLHQSGYRMVDLQEPKHPATGMPLSLLLIAEANNS